MRACVRVHVCVCRRILELGSGSGFLGSVVCSVCSLSSFTFSDCHNEVLELLVENICRNLHLTGELTQDVSAAEVIVIVVISVVSLAVLLYYLSIFALSLYCYLCFIFVT